MADNPAAETPGERVHRQRRCLDLDIRTLAAQAGIDKATVTRVEGNGAYRDGTLEKLATPLGVSVQWLRDGRS